eukprot:CAMPEP_0183709650 /NCGR_PEP_ID=MMETSP0737-20130205/5656_1 /TAXON_ID=385413 /ORGANISM="Thalassiosira miniscula, Strain CCMP1093" /LENGTH=315 /DNA_ID=CAMNT_0025937807 /DNA_START=211 /DNA_END=1158 /DNA_ORIENTATION=-
MKDIYLCMGKTLADQVGGDPQFGHHEKKKLVVFQPEDANGASYVNVDTSNREGILRAKKMGLVKSGKVDLIVTGGPLNYAIEHLYDKSHKGRLLGLFRHPVERLISSFYYRQIATWDKGYRPQWKGMDIVHWAENVNEKNNLLVKTLVGKNVKEEVTEEDLFIAIRTVRYRFVVGLTDHMEESIHRFNVFMGINEGERDKKQCMNEYFGHGIKRDNSNSHPVIERGSPAWLAIQQKNEFDVRLYMAIVEMFYEQKEIIASYAINAWETKTGPTREAEQLQVQVAEEEEEYVGPLSDEFKSEMNDIMSFLKNALKS